MVEPTIREVIEIQSGYTSYVDLNIELFDEIRNTERMSQYRPIASHRKAFEKLAKSLNPRDKRCYLLMGTYGTGKSHLCLMFANYMQLAASEQSMPSFFAHYALENPQEAEILKAKRQSGRYLIALCDWSVNDDFTEVIMRAVDKALTQAEFGDTLETPYVLARQKIDEWRNFVQKGDARGRFYSEFEQLLSERNPGQTTARFLQRLENFDAPSLSDFKEIHAEITTAPFVYDKADLISVLRNTLSSQAFRQRFAGLLVLFDEFGDAMERGFMNPKAFQQFAQFCAETPRNCAPVVFVGTAHKYLTYYAKSYNAMEFRTASDRIEEIAIDPDGAEDIIAAIIRSKKTSTLWQETIMHHSQTFDKMLQDCTRLRLFTWLTAPKIRAKIIETIYPMHPMATFALLRLARDLASNNRTVYTFFAEEAPGSYTEYINITAIETAGRLNLYTADRLFEYFSTKLQSDNKELRDTVRVYVRDYESSIQEQKRVAAQDESHRLLFLEDPLVSRILRLMLIYQIVQIENKLDNLLFGLYLTTPSERKSLQNCLRELTEKGILYYVKDQDIYEFKQHKAANLDHLVDEYKRSPDHMPTNLAAELNILVPLDKREQYLDAKDYNQFCNEDKRLERRFVRAIDLSTEQGGETYFDKLEAEIAKSDDFEGISLYVTCETQEDIQKARNACSKNASSRIAVAIPKRPVPLLDTILELRALQSIEASEEAKNFSHQDIAILNTRLSGDKGAKKMLQGLRNKLMNNREVTWYGKYAQIIPTEDDKPYDAANRVMELVYASYRNCFAHDDFNKLHKIDLRKNFALKEAIEKLLDLSSKVSIDSSFAQSRGDYKYLSVCFLQNSVLNALKTDGTKTRCDFEANPQQYEGNLPTLAEMVREVQQLKEEQKIWINSWVKKYRKAPYGQGPVSLALSLACLRRLFGDSIRIKPNEAALIDLPLASSDDIFDLIERQYPNAFLSYRQLREEEKAFINYICRLFGTPDTAVIHDYTVFDAYTSLKAWWNNLPPISRVASIYMKSQYSYTADFIHVMEKIEGKDAYSFLFDDLPTVFGVDAGTLMTQELLETLEERLPREKEAINNGQDIVEERILEKIRIIFGVGQTDYNHILEGIHQWYNSLESNQRDTHAEWHTKDSKSLLLHLQKIESLEETFFKKIPASSEYNLKAVSQWMTDRVNDYTSRLEKGKKYIDAQRIKVEPAQIIFEGLYQQLSNEDIQFKDRVLLTFQHTDPEAKIYLAEGNAIDPTNAYAARRHISHGEQLVILESKILQVAVQDYNGNWSVKQTLKLSATNAQHESEFAAPKPSTKEEAEIEITVPTDANSFVVICRTLFAQSLKRQILTKNQLIEIVQSLLTKLEKENDANSNNHHR